MRDTDHEPRFCPECSRKGWQSRVWDPDSRPTYGQGAQGGSFGAPVLDAEWWDEEGRFHRHDARMIMTSANGR